MKSLNVLLLEIAHGDKSDYLESEVDLDPNLPEKYDDLHRLRNLYREAFYQIHDELLHAGASKFLYRSRLEGDSQVFSFLHDGNHVPLDELAAMNEDLTQIADRNMQWGKGFSGNRIAAQKLQRCRGRVTLENLDEGDYSVQTTVKIPVKAPFP